jgi:hypothetical protein
VEGGKGLAEKVVFKVKDIFGNVLSLREDRHGHILERPEMANQDEKIKETLKNPDIVKESNHATDVLLYYRLYESTPVTKKYMLVVAKINKESFIITAFYTDKIKKGATRWER